MFQSKSGNVELNNGYEMPKFGLGTWLSDKGKVQTAVEHAIEHGYRHIDCAWIYGNEDEVGTAIKNKIQEGVVKREDLFITTKIWPSFYKPEPMLNCLNQSLERLQTDYVDQVLLHNPMPFEYKDMQTPAPKDENQKYIFAKDVHYTDAWRNLENIFKSTSKIKTIGISNFNIFQVRKVLEMADIKPQTNQCEMHPYFTNEKLQKFCKANDIQMTAYCPLGSPGRPGFMKAEEERVLMEAESVVRISKKYGKSPAQVLIRLALDRGLVVIPKSVTPTRIEQNFDVFDFKLEKDEIDELLNLNNEYSMRYCAFRGWEHSPFFPWAENYSE